LCWAALVNKITNIGSLFSVRFLPTTCTTLCCASHCCHLSLQYSLVSSIVSSLLAVSCLRCIALSYERIILKCMSNFEVILHLSNTSRSRSTLAVWWFPAQQFVTPSTELAYLVSLYNPAQQGIWPHSFTYHLRDRDIKMTTYLETDLGFIFRRSCHYVYKIYLASNCAR